MPQSIAVMGSLGFLDTDHVIMSHSTIGLGKHKAGAADQIDWERYGLNSAMEKTATTTVLTGKRGGHDGGDGVGGGVGFGGGGGDDDDDGFHRKANEPKDNDLFAEDQSLALKPWWKANFFLSEPVLFGTWDGVFTSCMINILGVIVFLRSGWMVAQAGLWLSILVIVVVVSIALITVLSAIGICSRCHVERGGIYFIISHVCGARFGGAIGLLYCFGQAAGAAIQIIGFGETMAHLVFRLENVWMERFIGVVVLVLLIGIQLLGVLWIIKLQFVLLITLLLATMDFAVGSFIRVDQAHGVDGYRSYNFWNNTASAYSPGDSWFTVFGVFFPTVTGILAGINMSGDLRNPSRDIPVGTLSALGISSVVYVMFVLVLGSTCQRWALRSDFMIAEKVSSIGFLLLGGLYVASLSSSISALYATPRVLQSMANENVIGFLRIMGRGKGPNQVPVLATLTVGLMTLVFFLVGDINTLAPLVTLPFLLAYAATDYAYFSLSMTCDLQREREECMRARGLLSDPAFDRSSGQQSESVNGAGHYGSLKPSKEARDGDLDTLFPERTKLRPPLKRQYSSQTSSLVSSPDEHSSIRSEEATDKDAKSIGTADSCEGITDLSQLIPKGHTVSEKSHAWHQVLCNRWLSLLGVLANLFIMFLVHPMFTVAIILVMWIVYFYIRQTNPGAPPGITEFKMLPWLKHGILRLLGRNSQEYSRVVVTPMHPGVKMMAAQLTEDNVDYATRERYHHSAPHHDSRLDAFDDD